MKWEGIIKSILKILGQLVYETCLVHQANYGSQKMEEGFKNKSVYETTRSAPQTQHKVCCFVQPVLVCDYLFKLCNFSPLPFPASFSLPLSLSRLSSFLAWLITTQLVCQFLLMLLLQTKNLLLLSQPKKSMLILQPQFKYLFARLYGLLPPPPNQM